MQGALIETRMVLLGLLVLLLAGCADAPAPGAETASPARPVLSLRGDTLPPLPLSPERRAALEADLAAARAAYEADPDDADALIWLGRRMAYLGRYHEAIDVYSHGLTLHPDDPRLYRHRGHRYITVRNFDRAIADLSRAAELMAGTPDQVEPDGAPNPAGIPRSTLHTNVWYHLGLAHYLNGDYEAALAAYQNALDASTNDDMLVATADWLYMTLRRLGRDAEAAAVLERIHPDMEILENHDYYRRLQMYRGELAPEALLGEETGPDRALSLATQGYGVGNWYLYNGQPDRARAVFEEVLAGAYWPAFGYIAAEADLRRMR
ncbi:MAG: tetratricopeptide repeat protein [Bacteroidetes bacterium]|nr:MAG: tetratricopeptide repeat protein [Bacteroidota bacterium]